MGRILLSIFLVVSQIFLYQANQSPPPSIRDLFEVLSRGVDISHQTIEDVSNHATWKNALFSTSKESSQMFTDKNLSSTFPIPAFLSSMKQKNYETDVYNHLPVEIALSSEDLRTKLTLQPGMLPLRALLLENRFKDSSVPTGNALYSLTIGTPSDIITESNIKSDTFTGHFEEEVKKLLEEKKSFTENPQIYLNFSGIFGTHYIWKAELGGLLFHRGAIPLEHPDLENPVKLKRELVSEFSNIINGEASKNSKVESLKGIQFTDSFYGGKESSWKNADTFLNNFALKRALIRAEIIPITTLIKDSGIYKTHKNLNTVLKGLTQAREVSELVFALNRLNGVLEVARRSPLANTVTGLLNADKVQVVLDQYRKMKPYPKMNATVSLHLNQMVMRIVDYHMGMRGTL